MRYLVLIFIIIFIYTPGIAQEGTVDVGVSLGTNMISGDLSSTDVMGSQGLSMGVIGRYNFNERIAVRATADYGEAKAVGTTPFLNDEGTYDYDISRSYFDVGGMVEFNWFDFVQDRFIKSFSPYLGVGGGFFSAAEVELLELGDQARSIRDPYTLEPIEFLGAVTTGYINVAFGTKYRVSRTISISGELFAKNMFTDQIDGLDDPLRRFTDTYNLDQFATTSTHNNDWIFGFKLSILYQFYKGCNVCPN